MALLGAKLELEVPYVVYPREDDGMEGWTGVAAQELASEQAEELDERLVVPRLVYLVDYDDDGLLAQRAEG